MPAADCVHYYIGTGKKQSRGRIGKDYRSFELFQCKKCHKKTWFMDEQIGRTSWNSQALDQNLFRDMNAEQVG